MLIPPWRTRSPTSGARNTHHDDCKFNYGFAQEDMDPLLGGLETLRHNLLLGGLRCLGAGHLVELAPNARFIVRMHLLEVRKLPLGNLVRDAPHGFRHIEEEPRFLARIEQIE